MSETVAKAPPTPAYANNSAFSSQLPMLQLAWDSTSLGEIKLCPRRYYYSLVCGWEPRAESVHLRFGILLHGARERYDHAKAEGLDHEEALARALRWVLAETWDKRLSRPWISGDENKNRLTLVRTVVWYLDEKAQNDPLETVILANGKPAVELSFHFETGFTSPSTGEAFSLCGHLDRIANLSGDPYIVDLKTTKTTISANFFDKYSPDNQFSTYMLAGRVAFAVPVKGLIVDAAQIAVTFSRFQRGLVQRSEAQVSEWADSLGWWFYQASMYASRGQNLLAQGKDPTPGWPMNDKACDHFGSCKFRPICAMAPSQRPVWLETNYQRRQWDPLKKRGDI